MNKPKFSFALREDLKDLCDLTTDPKLTPEMFLPTKSEEKASGYDVRCAEPKGIVLKPNCYVRIPLGFRMFAPEGWWLKVVPRSSTFIKLHIHALYGVIDQIFEHQNMFIGHYIPDASLMLSHMTEPVIKFGERIAQIIPVERQEMEVESISNDNIDLAFKNRDGIRGVGFGSSGRF